MELKNEYKRWWRKLTKDQKQILLDTNFDYKNYENDGVPLAHRYIADDSTFDENERKEGYDINYNSFIKWSQKKNEINNNVMKNVFTKDEVLEILSRVLMVLDESNDLSVKLHATCIKISLGMPGQPTMTALAKTNNLTRAAVSLRVKTIQKNLGLSPSFYMKSEHACLKLSKSRNKKLWQKD